MKPALTEKVRKTAEDQGGVITLAQAYEAGLSDHQVRWQLSTRNWVSAGRGVFRVGAAKETWLQRVWIACLESDGVASHQTAGQLFRLDGVGKNFRQLHVTVSFESKRKSTKTKVKRSRTLVDSHISKGDGVPRTSLARTLIDLAGVLTEENLAIALDSGLRLEGDLRQWIGRVLGEMPKKGLRGIGPLKKMIAETATAVDSALEVKLRRLLKRAGLPDPTPHYPVFDEGRFITWLDFAWGQNDPPVALMAHGVAFHHDTPQWNRDNWQVRKLNSLGWRVVPCSHKDIVETGDELVRDIKRMLEGYKQPAAPKAVLYERYEMPP